jgi:hypothetical protein
MKKTPEKECSNIGATVALEILIIHNVTLIPQASVFRKVIHLSEDLKASRIWLDAQNDHLASAICKEAR